MKIGRGGKKAKESAQTGRRRPQSSSYSSVFSYNPSSKKEVARELANEEKPEKQIERRSMSSSPSSKRAKARHLPTLIVIIVILISLIYATLIDYSEPQIVQVSSNSQSLLRSNQEYQLKISAILSSSFWNKSKLFADTSKIEKDISDKFPELGSVSVNFPIVGNRPVIQVSPATPTLIVRGNTGSFVIDSRGRAIIDVKDANKEAIKDLNTINDSIGSDANVGDYILPESTVEFYSRLKFQMEQKGLEIEEASLPTVANELHIKVKGQGFISKYNLSNDVLSQVGSYFAVTNQLGREAKPQPREYIDLRVDGRAYYK